MSPRPSSRESIIDAAEAVVVEAGAAHLTLDAVAAKAGISKGGLMYHFPSKDALLKAMVSRLMDRFEQIRQQTRDKLGSQPHALLQAHVMTASSNPKLSRVAAAILAAAVNEPKLLSPIREHYIQRFAQYAAEGLPFEKAALVTLATSGLWWFEQLQISPFDKKQRESIIKTLLNLIESKSS